MLSGLLVAKDYSYTLLDPRDLRDFAGLTTCVVTQRQQIHVAVGWELVRWHLEGMYGKVEEGIDKEGVPTMRVRSVPFSLNEALISIKHLRSWVLSILNKRPNTNLSWSGIQVQVMI